MAGELVVIDAAGDSRKVAAVARHAMRLARAASAVWVVGAGLATLGAYLVYDHLVSTWGVQQPDSILAPLALGLGPALVLAAIAAGVSAQTARLAHAHGQGSSTVASMARALSLPGLARRLSIGALVILAIFTVLNAAWLFGETLSGMAARDSAAAAWSQIAAAALMTPFGLVASWLLGRADATLRTSIASDGHYWWDGEYWHPLAG